MVPLSLPLSTKASATRSTSAISLAVHPRALSPQQALHLARTSHQLHHQCQGLRILHSSPSLPSSCSSTIHPFLCKEHTSTKAVLSSSSHPSSRRSAISLPLLALLLSSPATAQALQSPWQSQGFTPTSHRTRLPFPTLLSSSQNTPRVPPLRATWHPLSTGDERFDSVDLNKLGLMTWTRTLPSDQDSLVHYLQRVGLIKHDRVLQTMTAVDRGLFVPQGQKHAAYADSPQPIGFNATISAPHMHAQCLELLSPFLSPGAHALDVGSGTGYLTACFALLVGEGGKAVGVEHIPELAESSIINIRKCGPARPLMDKGVLEIHAADGRKGWREHAPFKAIHVGAAAAEVPRELIEQLAVGGRMVIPVGSYFQDLRVIDKLENGTLREFSAADVRYVPLTDRDLQIRGA